MGRPAPPLQMIQAFLAAARRQSFRLAAEEVGLSPSAFSRRISSLEALLGVSLYDRSGPAPRLTEVGEAYCRKLEPALEAIQQATDAVRGETRSGRVRVMCPPSFAINWLMPRLKAYFDQRGREDVAACHDLVDVRTGHVGPARGHLLSRRTLVRARDTMDGVGRVLVRRFDRGAEITRHPGELQDGVLVDVGPRDTDHVEQIHDRTG